MKAHRYFKGDHILFFAVIVLLVFGVIMITSIGVPKSLQLTGRNVLFPNCGMEGVDCYHILKQHLVRLGIGLVALFVFMKINYKFWRKTSFLIFVASVILLFLVFLIGDRNNTFAQSWINIPLPFIKSIQPSEIAKLALIFYLSTWFDQKKADVSNFQKGFVGFCVVAGLIIVPVIMQPDLGSTMVLAAIAVAIYFVAGARMQHIFVGALIALFVTSMLVSTAPYLQKRFKAYFYQDTECIEDYCWQSEQAKIAVGSGGFFGRGLTEGIQKSYWLPQAVDDFIFAASAEEIGFLRTLFVIIAYTLIAVRGFTIAKFAPNNFAMLLATGITVWIVGQAFINIGVNISLLPITGITLPLVSYGGSSLVTTLAAIGILLNISKHTVSYATPAYGRRNRRTRYTKYSTYRRA